MIFFDIFDWFWTLWFNSQLKDWKEHWKCWLKDWKCQLKDPKCQLKDSKCQNQSIMSKFIGILIIFDPIQSN